MFGWFKKHDDRYREELRNDFLRVTTKLKSADSAIQMAVGHSINLANSLFMQRFGGVAGFRALSKSEKLKYIEALTITEENMAKDQPHASIGFALFKMWIGALTEEDEELRKEFSHGLSELSRKGDLPI
jgi:hypothetical protein